MFMYCTVVLVKDIVVMFGGVDATGILNCYCNMHVNIILDCYYWCD